MNVSSVAGRAKAGALPLAVLVAQLEMAGAGVVAARVLGPDGKGVIAASTTWAQTLGWMALLGLPTAASVRIARDAEQTATALRNGLVYSIGFGFPAAAAAALLVPRLTPNLGVGLTSPVAIAIWGVPTVIFGEMLLATNLALGRRGRYSTGRIGGASALLVSVVICAALDRLTPASFSFAWLASQMSAILITSHRLPWRSVFHRTTDLRADLRFGLRAHLTSLLSLASLRLDLLIMSAVLTPAAVGYYSVANNLMLPLIAASGAIAAVSTPAVAAVAGSPDSRRMGDVTRAQLRAFISVSAPMAVILLCVVPLAVPAVFGEKFRPAITLALILLPGYFLRGIAAITAACAVGGRITRVGNIAEGAGLLVTLVLLALLLDPLGPTGAAVASSVAYSVSATVAITLALRHLSLMRTARPAAEIVGAAN